MSLAVQRAGPRTLAGLAGLLLLALVTDAGAAASNKELEVRADKLDARLATVERASQGVVQLSQQIDAARQELRSLRGEIDQLQHELEELRKAQRDLYGDLDKRMLLIESGGIVPTPSLATTGEPASSAEEVYAADEATVYGDAFAALKGGRYEEASRGFQLYLTKYPNGPRADNAWYWLGESQYVQREFDAALKSFQRVGADFPESRKAADAQLKVGYCQYELKAFRNARATLQKVAQGYPGTEVARLAEQRLAKMDAEGR